MANFIALNSGLNAGLSGFSQVGGYLNSKARNEIFAEQVGFAKQQYADKRQDLDQAQIGIGLGTVERATKSKEDPRYGLTPGEALMHPASSANLAQAIQYALPNELLAGRQVKNTTIGEDGKVRLQILEKDGSLVDAGVAYDQDLVSKNVMETFAHTGYGGLTTLAESTDASSPEYEQIMEQRSQLAAQAQEKLGVSEEQLAQGLNPQKQIEALQAEQSARDQVQEAKAEQARQKEVNIGQLPGPTPDPAKISYPHEEAQVPGQQTVGSLNEVNYYRDPGLGREQSDAEAASDILAMNAYDAGGDTSVDMASLPSTDIPGGVPVDDAPPVLNRPRSARGNAAPPTPNDQMVPGTRPRSARDNGAPATANEDMVQGAPRPLSARDFSTPEKRAARAERIEISPDPGPDAPAPDLTQIARGEAVPTGPKVGYAPGRTVTSTGNSFKFSGQMNRPLGPHQKDWSRRAALFIGSMSQLRGGEITPSDMKIMQNIAETGSAGGIAMARIRASQMQSIAVARKAALGGAKALKADRKAGQEDFGKKLVIHSKGMFDKSFAKGNKGKPFGKRGIGATSPEEYEAWVWAAVGKNGQKLKDAGIPMDVVNVDEKGMGIYEPRWEQWNDTHYQMIFDAATRSLQGHNKTSHAIDLGPIELFPQTTSKDMGSLHPSIVSSARQMTNELDGVTGEQIGQMAESMGLSVEEFLMQARGDMMARDELEDE